MLPLSAGLRARSDRSVPGLRGRPGRRLCPFRFLIGRVDGVFSNDRGREEVRGKKIEPEDSRFPSRLHPRASHLSHASILGLEQGNTSLVALREQFVGPDAGLDFPHVHFSE